MFEAVEESRATLLPWLTWARDEHTSVESSRASIELFAKARERLLDPSLGTIFGAVTGVFCQQTGVLLGGTGVTRINAAKHIGEIGYWVRQSRRREGICARAAAAMISWCFTPQERGGFGLRRIFLFAAAPNVGSAGVARRLGLNQCALLRKERFEIGYGWVDTVMWDVLPEEWDTAQHRLTRG
jgi:RimJ/RimL family protein N-acetyltransferase